MSVTERALVFDCAGEKLIGILSESPGQPRLGVLVLVGGPQYRVGSHRQFVLLARRLAAAGIPVMRLDHRGMGDSAGSMQSFEYIAPDIAAAIDNFKSSCPSLYHVVVWGLCDAASAALLYWDATRDARVAGMVLLNPWVRSHESLARTHVKHYYANRIVERDFWIKLARGDIDVRGALRSFMRTLSAARSNRVEKTESKFQDRMASAVDNFPGPLLLVLSGHDFTAKEFLEYAKSHPRWNGLIERSNVDRRDLSEADHTFSTATWRQEVEALTLHWLKRSFPAESQ